MRLSPRPSTLTAAVLSALAALGQAHAQAQAQAPVPPALPASQAQAHETTLEKVVVSAKRENRVSKGATNLPLEIKDTPQSISTIDRQDLVDYGLTGSNDALRYGTGINVEQYETNRTTYNARGFDIMLTQIDGLGMTNDWGTVVGEQDTYLFERIELIRGANGLLTGVGNASGTINYVRKRPTNKDGGEVIVTAGSYDLGRVALDYNKVLTPDGAWAARLVAAFEDKDSYLRALHDRRSTIYGVVDGQVGDNGVLTFGFGYADAKQQSPFWGSLTLNHEDGSQADFPVSSSPSQDWTQWYTRSYNAFVEYTHALSADWDAKVTYNHVRSAEDTKLFYAYTLTGYLEPDNTGLIGWPYRSDGKSGSDILDANLSGRFSAFGRRHEAVVGLSYSKQKNDAVFYTIDPSSPAPALPAFPYPGNVYPEPIWGATASAADGDQQLTRLYAATRLALTDQLKGIVGLNAINLKRDGTSIYGGGVALDNDKMNDVSPYIGVVYEITPSMNAYASYSDIFQAQEQRDVNGQFLDPMKGVNAEVGMKAEWLDRRLLTTFALFSAEQKGLATFAGTDANQQSYYEPKDVTSRGFEAEATGRVSNLTNLTVGYTQLKLTGPDGNDIYEWVPRRTLKLRIDSAVPTLEKLRLGLATRWQSDVSKLGGASQDAYWLADAFAAWRLTDAATLRLNVMNLFDEKYLKSVQYGGYYGAPRHYALSLEYRP